MAPVLVYLLLKVIKDIGAVLRQGYQASNGAWVFFPQQGFQILSLGNVQIWDRPIAAFHQIVDHPLEAHFPSIIGSIDPFDPMIHQGLDLLGKDDPAPSTEYFDMARTPLLQQVVHIPEILIVSPLVGGHGNGLDVLLNRTVNYLGHTAVMPQMDHLCPGGLENPSHDVNGRIMTVEEGSRGNDPDQIG